MRHTETVRLSGKAVTAAVARDGIRRELGTLNSPPNFVNA